MSPGRSRRICTIWYMFPGLDLHYTGPVQHLKTAGQDPNDLCQDPGDL